MEPSESDIINISALRAKDPAAWSRAFRILWPMALSATQYYRLGLSREDAEEAASEGLVQVARITSEIQDFQAMKAFVVVAAYRRAISLKRKKEAQKRSATLESIGTEDQKPAESELPAPAPTAYSRLPDEQLSDLLLLLLDLLGNLDATTRRLVVERVAHGCTFAELSQKFDMPMGTVCPKVARALQKLRQIVKESPRLEQELSDYLR